MNNSKRLSELLNYLNLTQAEFARIMGWPKASMSMYMSGKREMKQDRIGELYAKFKVDPAWLLGFDVPMFRAFDSKDRLIPIYGRVCAGNGVVAFEDIEGYVPATERTSNDYDLFALRVQGDSMEPKISDGDVVVCRKQDTADAGDVIIAIVNSDEAVCKKLKPFSGGVMLLSNNQQYEPLVFTKSDIESGAIHIIGKVIELRGKV